MAPPVLLCLCLLFTSSCLSSASSAVYAKEETPVVTCGFSRDKTAMELILGLVRNARESILVAAYSFTSKPIAEELKKAHERGVKVLVMADGKANRTKYTAVTFLANHNIPVRLNDTHAIMHHKFMIIDGRHVQTGSFNYTQAAHKRNAENVLVLRNLPDLARLYAEEWETLWSLSEVLLPKY